MPGSIVISGIGVVSPYGVGRDLLWQNVCQGQSGLKHVTRFDASQYRNELGGEVPGFAPGEESRAAAFALTAAQEAVADAGLVLGEEQRVGLVLGTNFSGMESAQTAFAARLRGQGQQDLGPSLSGHAMKAVRRACPSAGPEAALSLSCASGAAAIGTALEWIRAGRAEVVLAGGYDELSETAFAGLSALRAISRDTVRPFAENRSGCIFSEGACLVVVETAERVRARGAKAYAALLGRGMNNDAFHMTAPEKTGKGIAAVMRMALADAGLSPEDILHLNCHGTGTKYNDLIETTAVREVFGNHAEEMVFTANKSLFGHTMGAAGALEAAVTCLSLQHGLVPPTRNCDQPDPELGLDLCTDGPREINIPFAMTNSYGLGGTNASLVLGRLP